MAARRLHWIFLPLLLLPALAAASLLRSHPYLPGMVDDAHYWQDVLRVLWRRAEGGGLSSFYWVRGTRGTILSLLGLPAFLLAGSIPKAMLVMPACLGVFTISLYGILRRGGGRFGQSLCGALLVSFLPVLFRGSLIYMGELPFVTFGFLGAWLWMEERPWLAGVALGVAFCFRPGEALLAGVFLGAFLVHQRGRPSRRDLMVLASALVVVLVWFWGDSSARASGWVRASFWGQPHHELRGALSLVGKTLRAEFGLAGIALICFAVLLPRSRAPILFAAAASLTSMLAIFLFTDPALHGETRFFLAPFTALLASAAWALRDRPAAWLILAPLVYVESGVVVAEEPAVRDRARTGAAAREACLQRLRPVAEFFASGSPARVWVHSGEQLSGPACNAAFFELGKRVFFEIDRSFPDSRDRLFHFGSGFVELGEHASIPPELEAWPRTRAVAIPGWKLGKVIVTGMKDVAAEVCAQTIPSGAAEIPPVSLVLGGTPRNPYFFGCRDRRAITEYLWDFTLPAYLNHRVYSSVTLLDDEFRAHPLSDFSESEIKAWRHNRELVRAEARSVKEWRLRGSEKAEAYRFVVEPGSDRHDP